LRQEHRRWARPGPQGRVDRPWNLGSQDESTLFAGRAEARVDSGQSLVALFEALRGGGWLGSLDPQEPSALLEVLLPIAIGQQTEVANADEAERQDVKQESADELRGVDLLGIPLAIAAVVLVAEDDVFTFHAKKPIVGNGDAMRVASEILEDRLGPTEWALREDDPISASEPIEQTLKCDGMLKLFEWSLELENRLSIGTIKTTSEGLLEEGRQDADMNKEIRIRLDPTVVLDRRARGLHDAAGMRVKSPP
jgi:hypothetical protein